MILKGEMNMDVIKELQNSEFFIKPLPQKTVVVMAYVPYQNAGKVYSPECGIKNGTMFPELNKPFMAADNKGGQNNE